MTERSILCVFSRCQSMVGLLACSAAHSSVTATKRQHNKRERKKERKGEEEKGVEEKSKKEERELRERKGKRMRLRRT